MKVVAIRFTLGALFVAMAAMSVLAPARSGPLRDRLVQRRAQGAQGQGEGMMDAESADGPASLPSNIRVVRDVAYGPDRRERLDVYAPQQASGAPVIFMAHGGGWIVGDKSAKTVIEGKVGHWVPRGFVFISINYPMLPATPVSEQALEVDRALAFAQKHAADWGGDARKFVLMGHSAGAHLVALVNARQTLARTQGVQPWLGTVALDSAAYDVAQIMRQPHLPLYDRAFGNDASVWSDDSPSLQLAARISPFLAVCSSQRQDSCPQARRFVAKAIGLGGVAQMLPEDKTHRQINETLGADPAYTAQVDAFLRSLDPSIARLLSH